MELKPGSAILIPCEVKPGPFSNERLVKVGNWVGFVNINYLENRDVQSGATRIRAVVVRIEEDRFLAKLPGSSLDASKTFEGELNQVAALQA